MFRVLKVTFATFSKSASRKEITPVGRYVQHRTIVSKKFFVPKEYKPKPFPYKETRYGYEVRLYDHMFDRFDENTKLIVVDGQIAVGKHDIAKQIADELGFEYFPDVTLDQIYINSYGFDYRDLDYKLPENAKTYDEKKFHLEPNHFGAAAFQANKYRLRFAQYMDCLAHLMNTGQGVVVVRSPYSDCIFANAMADVGYISEPALYTYNETVRHTILYLMRPHLFIWIGATPEATIKNIKNKDVPWIKNSTALTNEYLEAINRYAGNYILGAGINSFILQYDWSDGGDVDIIVEDIERLNFEEDRHWTDPKFCDWNMEEEEAEDYRQRYSGEKDATMHYFGTPCVFEAPEMFCSGAELEVLTQVYEAAPGHEYDQGWNPKRGDKTLWRAEDGRARWRPLG